jgi:hypothetical protein
MRKRRFLIGLPIVLLSGACGGGGDRYAIVSGGKDGAYRLDKSTGEVLLVNGRNSVRILSPASKEFARADLRDVQILGLEKGVLDTLYFVNLYNGTAIEFSEVTFRIRARLYRTQVNIEPFAVGGVEILIIPEDNPPGKVVIDSAKGVRH